MKIYVEKDEWYPVYTLRIDYKYADFEADIPTELLDRIEKAFKEFEDIQEILKNLEVEK